MTCEELYAEQIRIEEEHHNNSILLSYKKQTEAMAGGRFSDAGAGKRVMLKAFDTAKAEIERVANERIRGRASKWRAMLRRVDLDTLTGATLKLMLNYAAQHLNAPMPVQHVLRQVGSVVETEALIACMLEVSPAYTNRTVDYLDDTHTRSLHHRKRTFRAGAENLGIEFEPWSREDLEAIGRLVTKAVYETGLFKWEAKYLHGVRKGSQGMYYLCPSEELAKYIDSAMQVVYSPVFPPCVIPPRPWEGMWNGGYFTEAMQVQAPMCRLRPRNKEERDWVVKTLSSDKATVLRSAMNKAQSVAYRINPTVLDTFAQAMAIGTGLMGLPRSLARPKPELPLGEAWLKDNATPQELEVFAAWKRKMAAWYTEDKERLAKSYGLRGKLKLMQQYRGYSELYFPTMVDWRGRLYFRSSLNPQGTDPVKACLELANGKPLGKRGLYWLRVHIANCCGYDKHDNDLRAKWTLDNWHLVEPFINDPLNNIPPEPDTAFQLYAAGLAYQEALLLPDPEQYVCHLPIAQDATCSGLQHFSAMLRDSTGATYTNLLDDGSSDKKADIYLGVAGMAQEMFPKAEEDIVCLDYWKDKPIPRAMAKKPVMTYVYGATLLTTVDSIIDSMHDCNYEPIYGEDGKIAYNLRRLALNVAKSLRKGVEQAVPAAAEGMKYLQQLASTCTVMKDGFVTPAPIRWLTPVGMPVVNWVEGETVRALDILSMGINQILIKNHNGKFHKVKARNSVAPNFIHSMDGSHLCMTIDTCDFDIVPIHDSFAALPCDVDAMRETLLDQFVKLYEQDVLSTIVYSNVNGTVIDRPIVGDLDLSLIRKSRFAFS